MLIIPAIDILDGRVSRLTKGDFKSVTNYEGTVLDYAKLFHLSGIKRVHIVDLQASVTGVISCLEIIEDIRNYTSLEIEFGGGIKSLDNAVKALSAGVNKLIIGSISISNKPEFEKIISEVGADKIISAIDVQNKMISIKGWTELSSISVFEHINYCRSVGVSEYLCTDIKRDGMLQGVNNMLYDEIMNLYPTIKLIASGGVSSKKDLIKLKRKNLYGCIVGKALYEQKITLEEIKSLA